MSDDIATLPLRSESGQAVKLVVFDFDGVFTDNTVWCDDAGGEMVRCWRSDGLGLQKLKQAAIPVWVLSTEVHPVVSRRCEKLRVPCRQGLESKEAELQKLVVETGVLLADVVYVGNDINDAGCLRLAGVPIVVMDAHPDVLHLARYQTSKPGGFGAVREVCDWVVASAAQTGVGST